MKIDWQQKLSSRKFWALIAALIMSGLIAFGADAGMIEKIAAVVTAMGSMVCYILGEATVDAARESTKQKE
jgi:hypothetical protein